MGWDKETGDYKCELINVQHRTGEHIKGTKQNGLAQRQDWNQNKNTQKTKPEKAVLTLRGGIHDNWTAASYTTNPTPFLMMSMNTAFMIGDIIFCSYSVKYFNGIIFYTYFNYITNGNTPVKCNSVFTEIHPVILQLFK